MSCSHHEAGDDAASTRALAVELGRYGRMVHVVKERLVRQAPAGLDFAALVLLTHLARCGPLRQRELAEAAVLDPSTTSRYVAHLVKADLVRREADPDDGRAVRLVVTPAGDRLASEMVAGRESFLRQIVADWPAEDVRHLTALLHRFNDELESHRPALRQPVPPPQTSSPREP